MKSNAIKTICIILGLACLYTIPTSCKAKRKKNITRLEVIRRIPLPQPALKSTISIEEALAGRRSRRDYTSAALRLIEVSQLLWAAQGVTGENGKRTAPSAGGTYPLEIYLVCSNVDSLAPGVYHYQSPGHMLEQIAEGNRQTQLLLAAMMQGSINRAAAVIVITAEYEHTTRKYADRGERFVYLEAGHAAQNICLQAVSLHIGVVTVGAFKDSLVKRYLGIPANEYPLYLLPVGKL